MTSPASSLIGKVTAVDPGTVINNFVQEAPPSAWKLLALGVFCMLAGTVVVTNTGEPFSLDE